MIKQNRTIIEQNIINLLKNIIICTWLMVSPNPPSLVTGLSSDNTDIKKQ
jgi:hypothetical protein